MSSGDGSTHPSGRKYRRAARDITEGERFDFESSEAPNPFAVVRHNMCSQRDASHVYTQCLEVWNLESSTAEIRIELRRFLTYTFCISTSKDTENMATTFMLSTGDEVEVRTIYDAMEKYVAGDNDSRVRVFVRCFEQGYFVRAQWFMLSDPGNVELRAMVAGPLGEDPQNARYMFDTADFLPQAGITLNAEELGMVQKYKAIRTGMATQSAHTVGEYTGRNDRTSVNSMGGKRVNPATSVAANIALPSQDARVSMAGGLR